MIFSEAFAQEQASSTSAAISVPPADSAVQSTTAETVQPSGNTAPANATMGEPSPLAGFLPFLIMGFAFYFLLLRPQQKRAKEHATMISAISRGDKVITSGGLIGKVSKVDNTGIIHVDIAESVTVQVIAEAISSVTDKNGDKKVTAKKVDSTTESVATSKSAKKAKVANDN
jgi:preprotein translocase subunit YajC